TEKQPELQKRTRKTGLKQGDVGEAETIGLISPILLHLSWAKSSIVFLILNFSYSIAMLLQFLGTGGAFNPEYGNSAALIRCNGKSILIDCGFTVFAKLKEFNLFNQIDYILITHLHNDHTGSL